jgi:hypothetical protein
MESPDRKKSTMPQYCFHFINGNPLIDAVIVDLSDLDAAKAEAKIRWRGLMSEHPAHNQFAVDSLFRAQ